MKRLIIALLLLPSLAWAGEPIQLSRMNPYILGAGVSAAAPDYCAGTTLFCSTFESATLWDATNAASPDCDGYDADGDWCDGDTTTYVSVLGSKSIGIRGSATYYLREALGSVDQGEFYVEAWIYGNNFGVNGGLNLRSTTAQDVLRIAADATDNSLLVKVKDLGTTVDSTYVLTNDQWYHIGVYFKNEVGTDDGIVRIWANQSTTAGFSYSDLRVNKTDTDTGAYLADLISFNGFGTGEIAYYDNVKVVAGSPSWTYE